MDEEAPGAAEFINRNSSFRDPSGVRGASCPSIFHAALRPMGAGWNRSAKAQDMEAS